MRSSLLLLARWEYFPHTSLPILSGAVGRKRVSYPNVIGPTDVLTLLIGSFIDGGHFEPPFTHPIAVRMCSHTSGMGNDFDGDGVRHGFPPYFSTGNWYVLLRWRAEWNCRHHHPHHTIAFVLSRTQMHYATIGKTDVRSL